MEHHMTSRVPLIAGAAAVCVGLALGGAPGFAGSAHHTARDTTDSHPRTHATSYAFTATGFGSRVVGGQVPLGSSTTAYQHIGCTNRAGLDKHNDIADAVIPGLGTASGIRTRVWTSTKGGVVASHSAHSIAQLVLANTPQGSLSINAIHSRAVAYHDSSGFHATTTTNLGDITYTPVAGPAQSYPAPLPGQSFTIPGLATLWGGRTATQQTATGAAAQAVALEVDLIPSQTDVFVAHTAATLGSGLTYGVFRGHSDATRVVQAAGDVAHSGPNPLSIMPCQGTAGQLRSKALASLDLGGQLIVAGASSSERGNQGRHKAHGSERAEVAQVNLGNGQLVVDGIVGKATVTRTSAGVVRTSKGTTIGSITANGQAETFPPTGVLEIPGVAKLERRIVTKSRTGLTVVSLRITLLDGSGAVIDLGEAALRIARLPS
jgi:hypothetical protein